MRLAAGFVPRQTIYLIFGQDEELGGERGALQIAKLLKDRGVRLRFVVDEGMLITEGAVPGLAKPAALIGVAEKGVLTLQLTANATPGHSSMPPVAAGASAIGMLSEALVRLEAHQMPFALDGVGRETFDTLAPEMTGMTRVALSNLWLFGPLVESQLTRVPSMNASFRTTTALTVLNAGQAENVLPGRATALVNFRLLPGDASGEVIEHVVGTLANPAIKVERVGPFWEASRVAATDGPGYRAIVRTLAELHPDVVVAPGLMIGATDSRYFETIADDIYKFSPMRARLEDLKIRSCMGLTQERGAGSRDSRPDRAHRLRRSQWPTHGSVPLDRTQDPLRPPYRGASACGIAERSNGPLGAVPRGATVHQPKRRFPNCRGWHA
jgi:carboxypeptidase PM20D1